MKGRERERGKGKGKGGREGDGEGGREGTGHRHGPGDPKTGAGRGGGGGAGLCSAGSRYLGTQLGLEPSISQVANRFMGTGRPSAPAPPGKLRRPRSAAAAMAASTGPAPPAPRRGVTWEGRGLGGVGVASSPVGVASRCLKPRLCSLWPRPPPEATPTAP